MPISMEKVEDEDAAPPKLEVVSVIGSGAEPAPAHVSPRGGTVANEANGSRNREWIHSMLDVDLEVLTDNDDDEDVDQGNYHGKGVPALRSLLKLRPNKIKSLRSSRPSERPPAREAKAVGCDAFPSVGCGADLLRLEGLLSGEGLQRTKHPT